MPWPTSARAELVPPPVVRLLGHTELPAHRRDILPVSEHPVRLPELADDLLRGVTLPAVRHDLTSLPARNHGQQDDSQNHRTYETGSAQHHTTDSSSPGSRVGAEPLTSPAVALNAEVSARSCSAPSGGGASAAALRPQRSLTLPKPHQAAPPTATPRASPEQTDEWAEGRRYLGLDILARCRLSPVPNTESEVNTEALPALTA